MGSEGERRAPESSGVAGGSPLGARGYHTGAYSCTAVADIAPGTVEWGWDTKGRDLNVCGGLGRLWKRCVRLPVGCHAPYNPPHLVGR